MIKKGIRRIEKEDILFILFCVLTAVIFASYRCVNGDFAAYNGDFQNYNIFRRLLDGQVSYRDFTNYLGSGVVFVNLPLVFFFRSFGASVFITHFTTSVLYSLILCVLFYTVCHDKKKAYIFANLVSIAAFVLLHFESYGAFYYQYIYDLVYFEEQGVSMRTTRAFLPFMLVGIFFLVKALTGRKRIIQRCFRSPKQLATVFVVMGMLTIWSNDYGYSCVICLFLIFLIVNLCCEKMHILRRVFLIVTAVSCIAVGAALSIVIITHGNIADYISVNAGIADYQFWYYGNYYGKYLTVFDIFSDRKYIFMTVFFIAHGIWFLIRAIRHKIGDYSICRLFLHSVCYSASVIYVLGSGAHGYAGAELVTDFFFIGLVVSFVPMVAAYIKKQVRGKLKSAFKVVEKTVNSAVRDFGRYSMASYIFAMLLLYTFAANIIRSDIIYDGKERVEGLHIDSVIGAGLDECAANLADGEIFSTYAGALETINGVFQPTGIDYIIHVLGNRQREKYLDTFVNGNYKYASTLKCEYTPDEYWLTRINWFFYRKLYADYKPTAETAYSIIWSKSEHTNVLDTDVILNKQYISDATYKIDVELPGYTEKGAYVDLLIRYKTEWTKNRLKNGGLRKVVCVEDGGEQYCIYRDNLNACYYLDEYSQKLTIPVYVRNGKGYVFLSSYPLSCTKLEDIDVEAVTVIREPEYFLHVTNYTLICPTIARDGVNAEGTILKFDNTEYNTTALIDAEKLRAGNEVGVIENIWKEGNYIYVLLSEPIQREHFLYPNRIEIEYGK